MRLGLRQTDLAAAAGVSKQAVSAIEADRYRPSDRTKVALARALGCHPHELFPLVEEVGS